MATNFPGEKWGRVKLPSGIVNKNKIEVSNYGRVRSFNKISNGNILKGSRINGYSIIRFQLLKPRDIETENKLIFLKKQVFKLEKKIKLMKENRENKTSIAQSEQLLASLRKNLSKKFKEDAKKRTIQYHGLVHRLVAEHFCKKPSKKHILVAHLDFNKLNNKSSNLRWMTPEENYDHQRKSPYVIAEKKQRSGRISKNAKLTVTKVMLLKKLLNQNKPMRALVKQFKVTDTQILRIKRQENWKHIEAAK